MSDRVKMRTVRALESVHDEHVRRAAIKLLAKHPGKAAGQLTRLIKTRPFTGHERAALVSGISVVESSLTERRLVGLLRHEVRQLRSRDSWLSDNIHPAMVVAASLSKRRLKVSSKTKIAEVLSWLPKRSEKAAVKRRLDGLRCELSAAIGRLSPLCSDARKVEVGWKIDEDLDALLRALKDPAPSIRMTAWALLGKTRPQRFREVLGQGLGDSDLVVAANVVDQATILKVPLAAHETSLRTLWERAWKSQDIEVLLTLVKSLESLKSPGIRTLLRHAAQSEQYALKRAASHALGESKSDSMLPTNTLTKVPNSKVFAPYRSDQLESWRTLLVDTEVGSFEISFKRAFAPMTVSKLGRLFAKGFYTGLSFHRVVPNFVVQGGDPRGDGWGGPGESMRCENNPIDYEAGTVGMALAGKDTGGSQFFVALDTQPHLLGTYTVFGRVSKGMNVVRALVPGDKIVSTTLIR